MKVEFAKTFPGVNFKSRVVYERMDIFKQFMIYKTKFFYTEKSYEAGNWHTNREKDAESTGENHKTLASISVEISAKKHMFQKWGIVRKNVIFLKNCWSNRSGGNLHAGPQDSFGKIKFEQRGSSKNNVLQKIQNNFGYSSQYKVKQSPNRT